jgi:hypothetical protein
MNEESDMKTMQFKLVAPLFALGLAAASGCKDGDSDDAEQDGTDQGNDLGDGDDGDAGDGGGNDGGEENPCIETEHPVGFEDETPLGFSGSDVVAAVAGPHASQIEWLEGEWTEWVGEIVDLTLDVSFVDGEVVYVESEDDPESDWPAEGCESFLRMGVVVGFATADGRFAEHWDVTISVRDLAEVSFGHEIDLDAVEGTFSRDDIVLGEGDELLSVHASGEFEEGGPSGAIRVSVSHDMGGGQGADSSGPIACWPDMDGC